MKNEKLMMELSRWGLCRRQSPNGTGCSIPRIVYYFVIIVFALFSQQVYTKDVELILHKDFLEKLIGKIFPISINKSLNLGFDLKGNNPFAYELIINKPVLSIQPGYVQVDTTVNFSSLLGKNTFPGKFKLIPIYNQLGNSIELKVVEGHIELKAKSNGEIIDFGVIDLSQHIPNIKIPLEINNFNIQDKKVKTQCRNVAFQLLKDKIIINSEIYIE